MTDKEDGRKGPRKVVCGARARSRGGAPCQQRPLKGRTRCKLHGGASPRGIESPNWKGRGYSKDLPTRYMDRIRESLEDPELTSCRNEIALIDARLSDLAQQLTAGGSADAFLSIRKIADGLRYYLDRPDVVDREERLEKLGEELQHELQVGVNESRVWREIHAALIQRRRLADTERKREELLAATLPHAQAVAFIGAVQTAVRELVTDKHTRAAIARRVAGIMHRSAPGPSPVLTGVDTGATHPALLHQQLAVEVEDGEFEVVKETP